MTGFDSKRQMAADKVLDLDGHVVGKVRKPQRPWVGLTYEEIEELFQSAAGADEETVIRFARLIEFKIKEKNT